MIKIIVFLRGREDSAAFHEWIRTEFAAQATRDVKKLVVNLVQPPPQTAIYKPPSDTSTRPFYDAVVQFWCARETVFDAVQAALSPRAALMHAYRVTETVIWDRQETKPGTQTVGLSFMGRLQFHEDMPDSAARRSWTLHATLARRVHAVATRYVQNWIDEVLTAKTPVARGVPDLHFASEQDMLEKFFDSPAGRDAVLQDTAHFIQDGPRLYTREFVIRA